VDAGAEEAAALLALLLEDWLEKGADWHYTVPLRKDSSSAFIRFHSASFALVCHATRQRGEQNRVLRLKENTWELHISQFKRRFPSLASFASFLMLIFAAPLAMP